jgi:pyroglutamyl-peptidase
MKILLTGFEPFNKALTNASEIIVREIEKQDFDFEVVTVILPVIYRDAFQVLNELVTIEQPDAIVSLGQAEGRTAISLERSASNRDDAQMADNSGEMRLNSVIALGAPESLPTTLPIEEIYEELHLNSIRVEFSDSAGNFLCNNLFFNSQITFTECSSGFIHVPLVDTQSDEFPGKPHIPLSEAVRGIEITLKTTASFLTRPT